MKQRKPVPLPDEAQSAIRDLLRRSGLNLNQLCRETKANGPTVWTWFRQGRVPTWELWKSFYLAADAVATKIEKNGKRKR